LNKKIKDRGKETGGGNEGEKEKKKQRNEEGI
jgi:hypothetical protein